MIPVTDPLQLLTIQKKPTTRQNGTVHIKSCRSISSSAGQYCQIILSRADERARRRPKDENTDDPTSDLQLDIIKIHLEDLGHQAAGRGLCELASAGKSDLKGREFPSSNQILQTQPSSKKARCGVSGISLNTLATENLIANFLDLETAKDMIKDKWAIVKVSVSRVTGGSSGT